MVAEGNNHFLKVKVSKKRPVIFVVGTTATGKSSWAMEMAKLHKGVIFNCDSIQVYKGLDVGSSKPEKKDYEEVPHYLFDLASAPNTLTTGDFRRAFDEAVQHIAIEQPIFLVGGSGFYFQAVEKGLYPVSKACPELRQQIERELEQPGGSEVLYAELKAKDLQASLKISRNDHYRLVRALEIIRSENKTLTEIKSQFSEVKVEPDFRCLKIGITCPREELWERIEKRARIMVQAGLRAEVKSFLDLGLGKWPPLSSIGYAQAEQAIRENKSDEWLVEAITVGTRQLAKKQRTWFKRDQEIFWIQDPESKGRAEELLRVFLQG